MFQLLRQEPLYSEILQEGLQEGRQEGRQQGVLAMQQTAVALVQMAFPDLEDLARARITAIGDLERLQQLIVDLSRSRSREEMERILLSLDRDA
jgi:predicted transposase YdaD